MDHWSIIESETNEISYEREGRWRACRDLERYFKEDLKGDEEGNEEKHSGGQSKKHIYTDPEG